MNFGKHRRSSAKQKAAQNRMKRAAKACKGKGKRDFRTCMRKHLKK